MKLICFTLLVCCIRSLQAHAQVANDDCAGGFAQGVWMLPINSNNCDQPGNGFGSIIIDSTDLAIPNFPYPTTPFPCTGYTPNVSVGGKDRWYSFRVNCDLQFTAQCSDSCHISFWSGADCSMLTPITCYTLLPGQSLTGLLSAFGVMPSLDTLSMQISDNGNGTDLNYEVCLMNPSPPCVSVHVEPEPTPVSCFTYEAVVSSTSSQTTPNGSIDINMLLGNAPFEITWNNGAADFYLDSLAEGDYVFTIVDAEGCSLIDTLNVAFDTGTGVSFSRSGAECSLTWNGGSGSLEVHAMSPRGQRQVMVFDLMGQQVWSATILGDHQRLRLPDLSEGLYTAIINGNEQRSCALKFVNTRNH
jgi:hypothetical protein